MTETPRPVPAPSARGEASTAVPRRRARHLMDPNAPRPVRNVRAEKESLTRVQQWVMSTLAVTTGLHMAAGLILAAMFLDERGPVSQVGLNVIAGIFTMLSIAAALAIHKRAWLSPWLSLGIVPTAVGLWLTFG